MAAKCCSPIDWAFKRTDRLTVNRSGFAGGSNS